MSPPKSSSLAPAPLLFGDLPPPVPRAPVTRQRKTAAAPVTKQARADVAPPDAAPPVELPSPPATATATPIEQAWAAVEVECPQRASADAHRHGEAPLVHVCPMGYPNDVYCEPGEASPGYPGYYRPQGGHKHRHPKSLVLAMAAQGAMASAPPALYSMKTPAYQMAEMTGR